MKAPFHTRLICCWLALTVLLSSTGFGMVEHWCQMRGYTKSLLLVKTGCAKPCQANESPAPASGSPVVKKSPCCKTTVSYEHLDVSRFVADAHSPASPQPAGFMPDSDFRTLLAALLPTEPAVFSPSPADDPLHRTGRSRLISYRIWLI